MSDRHDYIPTLNERMQQGEERGNTTLASVTTGLEKRDQWRRREERPRPTVPYVIAIEP